MPTVNPADQAQRLRRAIRFQQSQQPQAAAKRIAIMGLSNGLGVTLLVQRIAEELDDQRRDCLVLSGQESIATCLETASQHTLILDLATASPPKEILPTLDWLLVAGKATNEHLLDGYATFKQLSQITALPRLGFLTLLCEPSAISASREMRKRLANSAERFLSLDVEDIGFVPRFPASMATSATRWRPTVRGILKSLDS